VILIFHKYDGLTYHTSKYEIYIFNNVYKNKKYKAKLKTSFISSCLISFKEFGPTYLPFQEESMIPPPHIEINGEHEYEMEDILNSNIYNHQLQYLVH
jgi:hypothetical protein